MVWRKWDCFSLRKNRHGGNESHFQIHDQLAEAELELFFMALNPELYYRERLIQLDRKEDFKR